MVHRSFTGIARNFTCPNLLKRHSPSIKLREVTEKRDGLEDVMHSLQALS